MSLVSLAVLDVMPPVEGVTVWRTPCPAAPARFPVEISGVSGIVTVAKTSGGIGADFEMRRSQPVPLEAEAAHDLIWCPAAYVWPGSVSARRDGSWMKATWSVATLGFTGPEAEDAFKAVCGAVAQCLATRAALTSP